MRLSPESFGAWVDDTGSKSAGCPAEVVGEELGKSTKVAPCCPWVVTSDVGRRVGVDEDINCWLAVWKELRDAAEALRFVP